LPAIIARWSSGLCDRGIIDNQPGFPDVYPKAGNGFVVQLNGFVAAGLTKQSSKNPNDFSSAPQAKPQGKAFADRKPGATF
jgi:hypothetical protein